MKNNEIHNGLPFKEIRDFLSTSLLKYWKESTENTKRHISVGKDEWGLKNAEEEVRMWKLQLEIEKNKLAALTLVKMQGWEEFDVSDETEPIDGHWMSFIGTNDEFADLLRVIKYEGKNKLHMKNNIIENYKKALNDLYEHVGFVEDWVVYPIDDQTDMIWCCDGKTVKSAETLEQMNSDGDYYLDDVYTQRFYKKHIYEGKDYTMIFCDPGVDEMKWFRVFDNTKRIEYKL